jgi:hypothetical protein
MRQSFRRTVERSPLPLVVFGLLVAAISGCGDDAPKKDEANGGVPPVLKKSNENMQNFMNSQKAAKKK